MDFPPSGLAPWQHPDCRSASKGIAAPSRRAADRGRNPPAAGSRRAAKPLLAAESSPVRVLVVDDQPDVLATTIELFKLMGYEVLSASNGADAVEILQNSPDIQVLFSDVVMPGMSGIKLAHEARRLIPGINVILASGFQGEAMADADMSDFHFLVKPFRMVDVARLLRK
jgi:CheY-like chemotaxis protein